MTTALPLLILLILAATLVAFHRRRRADSASAAAAGEAARTRRTSRREATPDPSASPRNAGMVEWDAVIAAPTGIAPKGDAMRARIRDRYIAARFPGVFRGSADLRGIDYVIEIARQGFEQGKIDRTHELFELAIEESPGEPVLRLAQLEIAFLTRDRDLFTRCARELQRLFPGIEAWKDVTRLGRALAPGEELFGAATADRAHEHYGPWPDMPNWIQASWDLTSEVLAADFHRAMTRQAIPDTRPALRQVA